MAKVATPSRAPVSRLRLADVPDKLFDVFARVGRGLHAEEPRIAATQTHQFFVCAFLDQTTVLEEDDPVRPPNRGKAVRYVDRRPAVGQRAQPLEKVVFSLGIQG